MAIWKVIKSHPQYEVSDEGQVRTRAYTYMYEGTTEKLYQECKYIPLHKTSGYFYARLDGEICKVHRLVAEEFVENPENRNYVSHKDGNIENNIYTNLVWTVPKPNITRVDPKGIKIKCVEDGKEFPSVKAAATYYNVDYDKLLYALKRNKRLNGYTWVTLE